MGGPGRLRQFTNSKTNSEEEMEYNSYLLVDVIIPAEVSSPPWQHMDMNMLKTWEEEGAGDVMKCRSRVGSLGSGPLSGDRGAAATPQMACGQQG
ncbi:hypothetical protein DUI87_24500 [Hirundo rustica rustica]|uniref:Uncharacterized protein n=1 Tax=Hirundo rustica rustica TaxID=333673 RepID=A0A3M0JDA1_HIRRU|nr:hypothetical protein DUI87_24500 [Hirundo rustica rustica]